MQTDATNEFECEEPTKVYTPEQWEPKEVEWMLRIAALTDARKALAQESNNAA